MGFQGVCELDFKINYKVERGTFRNTDIVIEEPMYLNGIKRERIPFFRLLAIAIENYYELTNLNLM